MVRARPPPGGDERSWEPPHQLFFGDVQMYNGTRSAKIVDEKWVRFGNVLTGMGLCGQSFRVIGEALDGSYVVVHPDDINNGKEMLPVRKDIVEFVES